MCLNCIMIIIHETWWGAKTRYVRKGADRVMSNRVNLDNSSGNRLGFYLDNFYFFHPWTETTRYYRTTYNVCDVGPI